MSIEWEDLGTFKAEKTLTGQLTLRTLRSPVPGGWLVAVAGAGSVVAEAVTFVPDSGHQWDGRSAPR